MFWTPGFGYLRYPSTSANPLSVFSNVKYTGFPGLGEGVTLSKSPWGLGFCRLSKLYGEFEAMLKIATISEPKRLVLSYIRELFGMYKIFILRD